MGDRTDNQPAGTTAGNRATPGAEPKHLRFLPGLVLVLITLGFLPSVGFDFVNWDDDIHVYANPTVLGTASARDRWLTPSLGYPIPLTVASYRIEYQLVGASPWLYHTTNLLLHLGVCGLLYGLARRIGLGKVGASFALLFFGLHPVVAEPVSWISGRKDLLAALLGLAATWWFLGASARPERRWRAAIGSTVLFALAACSKPSVLALPLAWALARSERSIRHWRMALPAVVMAVALAAFSWLGQSHVGALHASGSPVGWARELLYALGYHLGLALFIQQPLAKHIPAHMPPWFDPSVDLFPLGIGLLTWILLRRMADRPGRAARFGLLFAVAAYLPSSGIVPLTRYLADCYVYLPLAGLAWLVGAAVETIRPFLRPLWRWAGGCAAALVLLVACTTTSMAWSNGITLWATVYQRYPDSPQVCLNFGNAYSERGRLETALRIFERCTVRFGPDHFAKNRAIALYLVGRKQEARGLFQDLHARDPNDPVVRKYLGFLGSE